MSECAGFVVHPVKLVLIPTQKLVYLGFWLNSNEMTVKLTEEKANKIKHACTILLQKDVFSIRQFAQAICLMVAIFPGVHCVWPYVL